jgi:hypothetical protein
MMNTRANVRLIRIIKLAAKKVMIKLNGSFKPYAPRIRSMPKTKKKMEIKRHSTWAAHQRYFI